MSQSPQAKDISRSSNRGSHSACDCGVSIELPQKYRLCLAEVLARDREELEAKGWPLRLEDEWWARICDTLWYAIIYIYIEDLTLMVTGNHMKHTNTIFRKTCVSIGTWIFDLTCLLYGTITGRFMVPTSSQIVWSSGQSATQAVRLQQESCRSIKECEGKQTAKWWVSPDWTMFNYRKKNDFLHLGMPRNCENTLKLHFSFGRWCDKALDFGVPYLWTNPWTSGLGCKSTSSLMPLEILKWLRGYVISPKEGGFSCQCW
jgi:hypothetical protein